MTANVISVVRTWFMLSVTTTGCRSTRSQVNEVKFKEGFHQQLPVTVSPAPDAYLLSFITETHTFRWKRNIDPFIWFSQHDVAVRRYLQQIRRYSCPATDVTLEQVVSHTCRLVLLQRPLPYNSQVHNASAAYWRIWNCCYTACIQMVLQQW